MRVREKDIAKEEEKGNMKKALITGISGQDGSYLAELLLQKEYEVHGLIRRTSNYPQNLKNIQHILPKLQLHFGDLQNENHLSALIHDLQPHEIYNLASQSDVRVSFDIPEYTGDITGIGVLRILEAVRKFSPESKLYQASSSEMFGDCPPPQNEESSFSPRNPYAAAKLYAHHICQIYRQAYSLFICCGILFNHESSKRGENFVTRKIAKAAARREKVTLGYLDSRRDWGYAPEYVEAMWLMMQAPLSSNYVVGTGEAHTVREFALEAYRVVGLDYREYIKQDLNLLRPSETHYLCADSTKIRRELKWEPKVGFKELVKKMVKSEELRSSPDL